MSDLLDFLNHISNIFSSRKSSTRRINRTRSKGFDQSQLNYKKARFSTDIIIDRSNDVRMGFNKKRNYFDSNSCFNNANFFDSD